MPDTKRLAQISDAIESTMRELGVWSERAPAPEAFEEMGPFGMRTMAFEQWIQFVFLPRVRSSLASGGPWPQSSAVSVHAMRNLPPEADDLLTLLREFDALFEAPNP